MSDETFNKILRGCWVILTLGAIFAVIGWEMLANIFMIVPAFIAIITVFISAGMYAASKNEPRED